LWFFKLRDPLKGEDFYKFHVEQKWPWELTLTPEQEKAFMAGLEAYDDNDGGCYPKREEGILHVYEPSMLISLFSLTGQFAAMGEPALRDPAEAIRQLLKDAATDERPGVLHITDTWMGDAEDIDGMDKYKFTSAVSSAMMAQRVEYEGAGGYADEDSGYCSMGVLVKRPEHVQAAYDRADEIAGDPPAMKNVLDVAKYVASDLDPQHEAAFARAEVEKSKYVNTLMFCYARIVDLYHATRQQYPHAEPKDVLSMVMARMLAEGMSGCTWVRPPSQEQHELAVAVLSNR
jgi:hypothetical protein